MHRLLGWQARPRLLFEGIRDALPNCEAGKYSTGYGWTACTTCGTCEAGTFRSQCGGSSASSCQSCQHGSWKEKGHNHAWDSTCVLCMAGRFGDAAIPRTSAKHYRPVPRANTRSAMAAQRVMRVSHAKRASTARSAALLQRAPAMLASRASWLDRSAWNAECEECPAGTFGDNAHLPSTLAHCAACASGQFPGGTGATKCKACKACAAGKQRDGAAMTALACAQSAR